MFAGSDGESEGESPPKSKTKNTTALSSDDSEGDERGPSSANHKSRTTDSNASLFGSDDEEEEEEEGEESVAQKQGRGEESRPHRSSFLSLENEEQDQEEEQEEEIDLMDTEERASFVRREDIELQVVDMPRPPKEAKLCYVRLPNILGIQSKPFDPDTWAGEEAEWEDPKMKRLNPETIVRWRMMNGQRQSNANFVRWSDGSLQLFLGGNEEVLDVESKPLVKDHLHIFAKQQSLIQSHGQLGSRLFFRPSSIHSKSHQKLTMAVIGGVKSKARKAKLVVINVDPEKEKAMKEAEEERRIRYQAQLAGGRKKVMSAYTSSAGSFLEAAEEDDQEYSEEEAAGEMSASSSSSITSRARGKGSRGGRGRGRGGKRGGGAAAGGRKAAALKAAKEKKEMEDFIVSDEEEEEEHFSDSSEDLEGDKESEASDLEDSGADSPPRKSKGASGKGIRRKAKRDEYSDLSDSSSS
ncbi:hypothetical protein QOT17_015910 [Balamuthia mandrillaris]